MSKRETTSARDELALVLANAQRFRNGSSMLPSADHVSRLALDDADAVLAAGYSKPRTITTVAELDDLPEGAVVLDPLETVAICIGRGLWTMGGDEYTAEELADDWLTFPATVLHEPEPAK